MLAWNVVVLSLRARGLRNPVCLRTPSALFQTKFGCRSGSAGVLVMEVGESQSERRQRLATLRKRNKETRVPQWRVNSITCKGRINLKGGCHGKY